MSTERISNAYPPSTSRGRWQSLLGMALFGCLSLTLAGCDSQSHAPPVRELHGAGSAFPGPLYASWFTHLMKKNPDLVIKYEGIGSGAGVQQFIDELVDFAASDDPLSEQEIALVDRGVRQAPMTSGAIVLAYNLLDTNGNPVTGLRLSRSAYAGIFLGEIRTWRDEEITRHNPNIAFPDLPIQVEYRLDASGTTSALTRHLSKVSQKWKQGPGVGSTVIWPVGSGMPRNRGVSRALKQVPGSITYLSYAYAKQEGHSMAILENKAGVFVAPNLNSFRQGLSELSVNISVSRAFVDDPIGESAYPIVAYSWILFYQIYEDPRKIAMLKELLSYGLGEGQEVSDELGYVALEEVVAQHGRSVVDSMTLSSNADTATSIRRNDIGSASDPISQTLIESAQAGEGDATNKTGTPTEAPSDIEADDVSATQEGDSSSTPKQKRGES